MDTKDQLEIALKNAMKAGDDVRKRTIRMVLAAIRQIEIDRQLKLDEPRRVNRSDVVMATEDEIKVLQSYLPKALDPDELKELVLSAIVEAGATSPGDMGKVMRLLMPRVAGRVPGDQVSAIVRQLLQ
jgi:uncharacterized protein YqeY